MNKFLKKSMITLSVAVGSLVIAGSAYAYTYLTASGTYPEVSCPDVTPCQINGTGLDQNGNPVTEVLNVDSQGNYTGTLTDNGSKYGMSGTETNGQFTGTWYPYPKRPGQFILGRMTETAEAGNFSLTF